METVKEKQPSLLRRIMDEVDMLDKTEQELLLQRLRKQEILAGAKEFDEKYKDAWKEMTEDEIANMVSENRKKWYEENAGH